MRVGVGIIVDLGLRKWKWDHYHDVGKMIMLLFREHFPDVRKMAQLVAKLPKSLP